MRSIKPPRHADPLAPRKGLGQHFLVSEGVLDAVVEAAGLTGGETVVEVGPGTGLLTRRLLKAARKVIAVELDERMVEHLRAEFAEASNLSVVQADMLALQPSDLVADEPYDVVSNLPYYVASPIIRLFLEAPHKPRRMVVMVQHEVAREMTAAPNGMGLMGLGVQLYAAPRIMRRVKPGSFRPAPTVESAIVRLDVHPQPLVPPALIARFFTVARAGFSAPRKQMRNTLSHALGIDPQAAVAWLESAGVDPRRRPETLSLDEWHRLTEEAKWL